MPCNVVQYLDFKAHVDGLESAGLWAPNFFTVGEESGPVRMQGTLVTADLFDVFALHPIMGRFFTAENQVPANKRVVVLTESFWRNHFNADPSIIGRKLTIDGDVCEIIGVAPRLLEEFNHQTQLFRPMSWTSDEVNDNMRYACWAQLFARLKPGAGLGATRAQVEAREKAYFDRAVPMMHDFLTNSGHQIAVERLGDVQIAGLKDPIFLLEGAVLFVLLIGCVNVANLLLARANAREGEFTVRVALGASRRVVIKQLLVESLLLSGLGSLLGLLVAFGVIHLINFFAPHMLARFLPFSLHASAIGFAVIITAVVAVAIGLIPAIHLFQAGAFRTGSARSRSASAGRSTQKVSSVLIVVQTAFALILLVGAGLLTLSFARALNVNPGFDPQHVITAQIAFPSSYRSPEKSADIDHRLLEAMSRIPGTIPSLATATPYLTGTNVNAFTIRNRSEQTQPSTFNLSASPRYLETLRIPLIEGRWFNDADTAQSRPVYVVDQDFAKHYFPHQSALGQRITFGEIPKKDEDWPEIVGVVGNVRENGLDERSGNPYLYSPVSQGPHYAFSVFLRTERPMADVVRELRQAVAGIDPAIPIFSVSEMESVISLSLNDRRSMLYLLVGFAGLALLLSGIGIYSVLAYDVSQRTREIGVRGALGASRAQIMELVLKQGLWKAGLGLLIGIAGALALSRFLETMLYQVKSTTPGVYVAVAVILLAVAIVASYLPARRAARIDPAKALQSE